MFMRNSCWANENKGFVIRIKIRNKISIWVKSWLVNWRQSSAFGNIGNEEEFWKYLRMNTETYLPLIAATWQRKQCLQNFSRNTCEMMHWSQLVTEEWDSVSLEFNFVFYTCLQWKLKLVSSKNLFCLISKVSLFNCKHMDNSYSELFIAKTCSEKVREILEKIMWIVALETVSLQLY